MAGDNIKLIGYMSDTGEFDHMFMKLPHAANPAKVTPNSRCCYCLVTLTSNNKTKDHLHPKSLGGKRTRLCCRTCNQEKQDMKMKEWIEYLRIDRDKQPLQGEKWVLRNTQYNRAKLLLKEWQLEMALKATRKQL